jgi:hypothetical protein
MNFAGNWHVTAVLVLKMAHSRVLFAVSRFLKVKEVLSF